MSTNRRKEPFRYVLKEPAAFELLILSINGIQAPPKPVSAVLYDISRSGCRLSIPLKVDANNNQIRIGLNMVLHEDPLYLEGILRWDMEQEGMFYYGVHLDIPETDQDRLPRELRTLAGERKIIVK